MVELVTFPSYVCRVTIVFLVPAYWYSYRCESTHANQHPHAAIQKFKVSLFIIFLYLEFEGNFVVTVNVTSHINQLTVTCTHTSFFCLWKEIVIACTDFILTAFLKL
jgi:hypothetical protein